MPSSRLTYYAKLIAKVPPLPKLQLGKVTAPREYLFLRKQKSLSNLIQGSMMNPGLLLPGILDDKNCFRSFPSGCAQTDREKHNTLYEP